MVSDSFLQNPSIEEHVTLIIESYERIYQKKFPVSFTKGNLVQELYNSDYIILSHGAESDPIFNYANLTAQRLWKMDWYEFTKLPSRLSAKKDKTENREKLLKDALQKGYIDNYKGVRIDKTGKEFLIENVVLWNLVDANGIQHGQAAIFNTWKYL